MHFVMVFVVDGVPHIVRAFATLPGGMALAFFCGDDAETTEAVVLRSYRAFSRNANGCRACRRAHDVALCE